MKKISIFAVLSASFLTFSCARTEVPGPDTTTLTVSLGTSVKTSFAPKDAEGKRQVLWTAGDVISANGVASKPLDAKYDGARTASFEFEGVIDAPYRVLYPAGTSANTLVVPAVQKYVPGSFDSAAAPMYCSGASTESMALKNLASMLRFGFTGSVTLDRIELVSCSGEPLSGVLTLEEDAGAFTGAYNFTSGAASKITIDFGDAGLVLGPTAADIFIPVIAGAYATGFEARVYATDGSYQTLKFFGSGRTIKAATVLEFPDRAFVAGKMEIIVPTGEYDSESVGYDEQPFPTDGGGHPLVRVGDKTRFFVKRDDGESMKSYQVYVNGVNYTVKDDGKGHDCIDVAFSKEWKYDAVAYDSKTSDYYASKVVSLPLGQFPGTPEVMRDLPYAAHQTSIDLLIFRPCYSIVKVNLSGSGKLASLKLSSPTTAVAGRLSCATVGAMPALVRTKKSIDSAVLNLTNGGAGTSPDGEFEIIVGPGTYTDMKLTMCGMDRKVCVVSLPEFTVGSGETFTFDAAYSPDPDIMFYEGFDCFVWGGNIMAGSGTLGYSPSTTTMGTEGGQDLTGLELAFKEPSYNNPGTGYIQVYSAANASKTVAEFHSMTESYCNSRNIMDYWLYRCQEYPGFIACGAASNNLRSLFKTPSFSNIDGIIDAKVEFDMCYTASIKDNLTITIQNGGIIKGARIDGAEVTLDKKNFNFCAVEGTFTQDYSSITIPASDSEAKSWHRVSLDVGNLNGKSKLYLVTSQATSTYNHGFYLDNIVVKKVQDRTAKPSGVVRLLYWNIQNGMMAGQPDSYKKFKAWVKKYQPDICVFCEAKSNHSYGGKTGNLVTSSSAWATLASGYGHSYVAGTGSRYKSSGDSFPQEVTSVYPITSVKNVTYSAKVALAEGGTSTLTTHGGGYVHLTAGGKKINIVPLHLAPTTKYTVDGVDAYQVDEIKTIMNATVSSSTYSSETNWIMLGDFNSQSPRDKWYYDAEGTTCRYKAHTYITENSDLKDLIADWYDGYYFKTTSSRIDFIYLSPALYEKVVFATVLYDDYAQRVKSTVEPDYYDPSDHIPIIVDFKF